MEGGREGEGKARWQAGGRARAGSSHLTRGTGGSPSPILCVAEKIL